MSDKAGPGKEIFRIILPQQGSKGLANGSCLDCEADQRMTHEKPLASTVL